MSLYDLSFCTPKDIPHEILEYDASIRTISLWEHLVNLVF